MRVDLFLTDRLSDSITLPVFEGMPSIGHLFTSGLETYRDYVTTLKFNTGNTFMGSFFNLADYIIDPLRLIYAEVWKKELLYI